MFKMPSIRRAVSRQGSVSPTIIGLVAIVSTWVLFGIARMEQPGYEPMRDTISSLASHGASLGWIGVLGISCASVATVITSIPLRRLSQPAALALGVAGLALLLVAFTRIACPGGAADCVMGPATDYSTATAHTVGLIVFEVTFVGAIGSAAICLWRVGSRITAVGAISGMVLSVLFFAVVPLDVGMKQRVWLLVNSLLICASLLLPYYPIGRGAVVNVRQPRPSRPQVRGQA